MKKKSVFLIKIQKLAGFSELNLTKKKLKVFPEILYNKERFPPPEEVFIIFFTFYSSYRFNFFLTQIGWAYHTSTYDTSLVDVKPLHW